MWKEIYHVLNEKQNRQIKSLTSMGQGLTSNVVKRDKWIPYLDSKNNSQHIFFIPASLWFEMDTDFSLYTEPNWYWSMRKDSQLCTFNQSIICYTNTLTSCVLLDISTHLVHTSFSKSFSLLSGYTEAEQLGLLCPIW